MVYLWLAILPSLVAIILSMITKKIIPSLLIGLWVGSFLVSPGILSSVSKTVDYILMTLLDRGNMLVLLFLYFFSGFVGLLKLSGGIKGFAKKMEKHIKTSSKALLSVWGLIPVTFIDCGFHVVATGAMIRPITKKLKIAKEKLAVMLNFSASPVITLIPIATTFVAFLVGVIDSGLKVADIQASAYTIFLQSIPFNLFSIVLILITIFSLFSNWKFFEGKGMKKEVKKMKTHPMVHEIEICPKAKFGIWNLIIPIGVLIFLSFFLMYWDGIQKVPNAGILEAFIQSDAYTSMFLAMFISTIIAVFLYFIQKIHMKMMVDSFLMGGNRIMKTIAILLVAWPIASVSKDLGLPQLITSTVGTTLPSFLVAVIIFLVSSGVAYSIGSSWGTFALIMPIGIPLAYVSGASIPLVAGAVFAGGTFGDVSSPLSGMVAMSSTVAGTSHSNYIQVAKRYTFLTMGISAVLYMLISFLI